MADVYSQKARDYFEQYRKVSFEAVHGHWVRHLPEQPGFALDVGAGSGRDASALAEKGWEVLAVEPADGLRELGQAATAEQGVQWVDDRLPELAQVRALSYRFNLILVSAVWMHLPAAQWDRAFRILTELLAPGGLLVITLRHGPSPDERVFHTTDRGELEALARRRALVTLQVEADQDRLGRNDVRWETLVFRLPDDGTGSLPLLRHIIVNDDKSSTYKLGLLRAITRIADSAPGMVLDRTDEWVDIPLGLMGLYWIKLYQPLILKHRLRQMPGGAGYGFVRDDFRKLADVSPLDLRVGQALSGDMAATVLRAIRDACRTVIQMPTRYITYPGTNRPVFEAVTSRTAIRPGDILLGRNELARFGKFRIPALLWDCCSRYACWLEPAIVNEWAALMRSYEVRYSSEAFESALLWEDGRRDTSRVRNLVDERIQRQSDVHCVWTSRKLGDRGYDIDHCFPWSRWSNNDLWNLMPATAEANARKAEKLPAATLLHACRGRIVNWWADAFVDTDLQHQFLTEAEASLPTIGDRQNLDAVFDGVVRQRMRLKMNQQLAEWFGVETS